MVFVSKILSKYKSTLEASFIISGKLVSASRKSEILIELIRIIKKL